MDGERHEDETPDDETARVLAALGHDGEAMKPPTEHTADMSPPDTGTAPSPIRTEPEKPHAPEPGVFQQFVEGAGDVGKGLAQGATLGWGEEGASALTAYARRAMGEEVPRAERGLGGASISEREAILRDMRRENVEAQARSPWLYGTGELVGAIPGMIATAPLGPEAAGVVYGALATGGKSEARGAKLAEEMVMGGAGGGALGALGAAAGEAAGNAARWTAERAGRMAPALGDISEEWYLRAMGAERGAQKRLAARYGGKARYAEGLQAQKVGEGLPTTRTMTEQAEAAVEKAGAERDALATKAADVPMDGNEIADRLEAKLIAPLTRNGQAIPGASPRIQAVKELADEFRAQGKTTFADTNAARKVWGSDTNFDAGSTRQQIRKQVYGVINEAMEDAADKASPELGAQWRRAGELEHVAITGAELGRNYLNTAGNRIISPSDYMAAGSGGIATVAATGNPLLGIPAAIASGVANKLVRGREHIIGSKLAGLAERGALAAREAAATGRAGATVREFAGPEVTGQAAGYAIGQRSPEANAALTQIDQDPNAYGELTPMVKDAATRGDLETMRMAMLASRQQPQYRSQVTP